MFTGSLEWVLDSKDDMQGESITVSLIDEHLMVLAKTSQDILTLKFQDKSLRPGAVAIPNAWDQ